MFDVAYVTRDLAHLHRGSFKHFYATPLKPSFRGPPVSVSSKGNPSASRPRKSLSSVKGAFNGSN